MNVTTITNICSSLEDYADTYGPTVSGIAIENISTIWPVLTGLTLSPDLSGLPAVSAANITLIANSLRDVT